MAEDEPASRRSDSTRGPAGLPASEQAETGAAEATARWDERVRHALAVLLETEVGALLDTPAVVEALRVTLEPRWQAGVARPAVTGGARFAIERLRSRPEPLADLIPPAARQHLEALVADPTLLSAPLVADLLQDPALEAVIHELLFDALRQFSSRINPFTADWGLPALLKLLPPIGLGRIRAAFEARRAEFEQRIEPEIRRFLQGFTRRAGERLTELWLRKQQEPELLALRQRLLGALLARPLAELLWPADDPKTTHLLGAILELMAAPPAQRLLVDEVSRVTHELTTTDGSARLSELLGRWGVTLKPDAPEPVTIARAGRRLVEAATARG